MPESETTDLVVDTDITYDKMTPANSRDELQIKIVRCADTIFLIHQQEIRYERTIKEMFKEILDDALRLSVDKDEVRRMLHEALSARGPKQTKISESYIRKLLPSDLKYLEYTRIDHKIRATAKSDFTNEVRKGTYKVVEEAEGDIKTLKIEINSLRQENNRLQERIEELEQELVQSFEVKGLMQINKNQMPIKIRVNHKEKRIELAEIDQEQFHQTLRQEFREKRRIDTEIAAEREKRK